jgi:hypothetical protein
MIDETLLTRALDEAGSGYDEPAGAREAILAAMAAPRRSPERDAPGRPLWRRPLPVAASVVALVVLAGAGLAVRSTDDPVTRTAPANSANAGGDELTTVEAQPSFAPFAPPAQPVPAPAPRPVPAPAPLAATDGRASGVAGHSASGAGTAPRPQPAAQGAAAPAAQPDSLAKVVKTGTVEILVADGKVSDTLTRLSTLAAGVRGFVADSKTQESGDAPSGVVTMRVPGASYEQMVTRVRALGDVRSATSTGDDVTAAFVDTEARLRTLRQTRAVYETLLARARSIGEVLAVQQQINGAQTQIEQLEGKLKVLTDQVTYATLTVSVGEKSAEAELAAKKEPSRLESAFDRAKDNFGDGLEWVVAASGTVAILLICLGVLLTLGWVTRRLLRRRLV